VDERTILEEGESHYGQRPGLDRPTGDFDLGCRPQRLPDPSNVSDDIISL